MTKSMTAFARADGPRFAWEIRTVNQRHVDANFRMPEEYRSLEVALRGKLKAHIHRGKVECSLRVENTATEGEGKTIDETALRQLGRLLDQVSAAGHTLAPVSALDLLRWPGVLKEQAADFEVLADEIMDLFERGLEQVVEMREREGAELERIVLERLESLSSLVARVRADAPDINSRLIQRIRDRLAELDIEADATRLETEMVIVAQKADILEELDRLDTHVAEIRKTFEDRGPIGRRLDFLMQELNREANTLSSKATVAETSLDAVELKVLIEQMREQIQNIE